MEAPKTDAIPVLYPRHGYLSEDAAPDFSNPDVVDQSNGKVIDLILNSRPFTITNVEYEDMAARVTVTYKGDTNDTFTAFYIPPFDVSERTKNCLGESRISSFKVTSNKCMLFRRPTGTSGKVDMVTRDIFVSLEEEKKPPFTTFGKRTENEWQFLLQSMTRFDQIMFIPKLHWRNLSSYFS